MVRIPRRFVRVPVSNLGIGRGRAGGCGRAGSGGRASSRGGRSVRYGASEIEKVTMGGTYSPRFIPFGSCRLRL